MDTSTSTRRNRTADYPQSRPGLTPPQTEESNSSVRLSARLEPFDSYWQTPDDVDAGFKSFYEYYRQNYLPRLPKDLDTKILVISCGPGYLVNLLSDVGYKDVLGIDSDQEKIKPAVARGLNCRAAQAFPFLEGCQTSLT